MDITVIGPARRSATGLASRPETNRYLAELDDVLARRAARSAWQAWAEGSVQARADALEFIAGEILTRKTEIGDLLAREERKTLPAAVGEVVRAGHILGYFAGEVVRPHGQKLVSVARASRSRSRVSRSVLSA